MARKRMICTDIVESDAFMDMPLSTQALYMHLCLKADDDGFLGNPRRVTAYIGASPDDYKLLVAKRFLIQFDSGVVCIKHWKMHNSIQKDRKKDTVYQEEASMIYVKGNKSYTLSDTGTKLLWDKSQKAQPAIEDKYQIMCQKYGKNLVDEKLQRARLYNVTDLNVVEQWIVEDSFKAKQRRTKFANFQERDCDMVNLERKLASI